MTDFLNFSLAAIRKISGFLPVFFVLTIFDIRTLDAQTRIKDIVDFEGVRENMLIGYGLVVGLNGTGDTLSSSIFTRESLVGMLERLGVNARDDSLKTDNVAAVMVTATLPPFAKQGTRIDLSLSAIGDADSLLGGTLLVTPLVGADGEVYAVAQGPVAVGGVSAGGAGAEVSKGVPTNGRIASGAIIEREISFDLQGLDTLRISLRNPDFTTARRIAQAINSFVGGPIAQSRDSATVSLVVPDNYRGKMVALITDIEQLRVTPDISAKVVHIFPEGSIRHIHGIYYDEFSDSLWCVTGDVSDECQIIQSFDKFETLSVIGSGDETWRAVSLLFTKDYIYYAMDAEFEQNKIFKISRQNMQRTNLGSTILSSKSNK